MTGAESGSPVRSSPLPASPGRPCEVRSAEKSRSPSPDFTREFDLLLACARGANAETIRELISAELDWRSFLRIAEHHRLIPRVYDNLSRIADLVPADTLEKLRRRYEANARQTLRLSRDLIQVLEHFKTRGIPALPYKGPPLGAMLHGTFSQRQFADIDLLVLPADVQDSKAALRELGYTQQCVFTPCQEESYVRSGYEFAFDLSDARNVLELKWRILPRFYTIDFDVAGFFGRSVTVEVGGRPVRTLCPEDLLVVLCVHATKHAWAELSLLCDISQLVQSQPIDWDRVLEQASELGIRRILAVNLALVRDLLNTTFPDFVGEPQEMEKGEVQLVERIVFNIAGGRQIDTESIVYFRLMLDLRERIQDRARLLGRLIFTPNVGEWETLRLPGWLSPLYHIVRMARLAAKMLKYLGRKPWSFWRGQDGRARVPVVP
jgi:Uncharacterised nucleotidyltransferase